MAEHCLVVSRDRWQVLNLSPTTPEIRDELFHHVAHARAMDPERMPDGLIDNPVLAILLLVRERTLAPARIGFDTMTILVVAPTIRRTGPQQRRTEHAEDTRLKPRIERRGKTLLHRTVFGFVLTFDQMLAAPGAVQPVRPNVKTSDRPELRRTNRDIDVEVSNEHGRHRRADPDLVLQPLLIDWQIRERFAQLTEVLRFLSLERLVLVDERQLGVV